MLDSKSEERACNFCGKRHEDVGALVAGPRVYICDRCIDFCVSILERDGVRDYRNRPDDWQP